MPIKHNITLEEYAFDELTPEAKKIAYKNWLQSESEAYADIVVDDFNSTIKTISEAFDCEFEYDPYDNHILKSTFLKPCEYMHLLRYRTWLINNYGKKLIKGKYYSTKGRWINGKYVYHSRVSKVILQRDNCPITGWYHDNNFLAPIYDFIDDPLKYKEKYQATKSTWQFHVDLLSRCLSNALNNLKYEIDNIQTYDYFEINHADNYHYFKDGTIFDLPLSLKGGDE